MLNPKCTENIKIDTSMKYLTNEKDPAEETVIEYGWLVEMLRYLNNWEILYLNNILNSGNKNTDEEFHFRIWNIPKID